MLVLFVKEAGPEFYKGYIVHQCNACLTHLVLTTINIGKSKVICWQLLGDLQWQKRLVTFISAKWDAYVVKADITQIHP